ncbi:mannitol dehydrogenase family protein [Paramicrobacterium fandaimingii]|uniref:mannitol dehydrogenase family protein n=1 Tax=Paramicrobacterium fandaimingii TaxID=2708079 RepID=UPI00141F0641|nr:mannitol dehydrogenase family protein [Microbacterium fandaimingii]
MTTSSPLTREAAFGTAIAAPPRIVHIGLGAFHRAHQAWYTAHAVDAAEWGIAAFTGRSPTAADELAGQGGVYTLIERAAADDTAEIIPSIVETHDGANLARLRELFAAPETAVVTLTVTETAYRVTADGSPNITDPAVNRDIDALRSGTDPETVLGRLIAGLAARKAADAGGIAVVSCDNIPDNGALVRSGTLGLAERIDADLREWIAAHVSFVSTSVDRITPRTTDADRNTAEQLTGFADASPVVTEPFSDWVLSGGFPAGRPAWETAGARFVDDIEPFERRKLWLLNGAHSLLAYAGLLRGHHTVAEAMADTECRAWVRELWDEDVRHLPASLDLDAYRAQLEERFDNARIAHHLAQIGMEGSTKLAVRIAPVVAAERADGRSGAASIRALAAWIALQLDGLDIHDANARGIAEARRSPNPVRALLAVVDGDLARDADVVAAVTLAKDRLRPADAHAVV